ncbi:hydroxylysine kinase [Brevipalpus obovatus]|uniref:hydroxylysine kinase n=1 Tax=Brevipalpus obovatus TaxID=246614 RepID=UPI003D9EABAB
MSTNLMVAACHHHSRISSEMDENCHQNDQVLEPGVKIKPDVDLKLAHQIAQKFYDIEVLDVVELNSYDDRNFLIKARLNQNDHQFCNQFHNSNGIHEFTLKITNSLDSNYGDLIEAIDQMIVYVNKANIAQVPYPVNSINGALEFRERLQPEQLNAIRLLRYVPGNILKGYPFTEKLAFQAGQLAARLDAVLETFHSPTLANRQFIWSLLSAPKLDKFIFAVKDPAMHSLAQNVLLEFAVKIVPIIPKLRSQIIHGDLNEQNLLVQEISGEPQITGIIDFNDAHRAPVIFDLAILCAYMALESKSISPVRLPKYIIEGYKSVKVITDEEMKILPICVMTRLAQSLVLGAYSHLNEPNNEYLLSTSQRGWQVLEMLYQHGPDQLLSYWK